MSAGRAVPIQAHSSSAPSHLNDHSTEKLANMHLETMPDGSSSERETLETHANAWVKIRSYLKEPMGEFLGTFILVYFGTASNV